MVLIAGFGHKSTFAGLAGMLAIASAGPGCVQGLPALEQRKGVGGAPSWE